MARTFVTGVLAAAAILTAQSWGATTVGASDGTVVTVTGENGSRVAGSMILYNSNWGYTTGTNAFGTEVILTPTGDAQRFTVTGINSVLTNANASGNSSIAAGLVLSGAPGAQAQLLIDHFKSGDTVVVTRPIVRSASQNANAANALRGTNQLIVYTPSFGTATNTNAFGFEVTVENGTVTKVGGNNSVIPADGFVISGHGTANDWLSANAIVGSRVELTGLTVVISTDASSYVFQARQAMDRSSAAVRNAWDSFVNAPFEKARASLASAETTLQQAVALASANPPQSVSLANQATVAANAAYFYTLPSRVAEARGTWYRPVEKNLDQVVQTLDHMRDGNFNELYIETWFQGYTIYPSAVTAAQGMPSQNPAFAGFDPLRAFVVEGRKRGIEVHAWIDGFMVGTDSAGGPVLKAHPEWSARTRNGVGSTQPTPDPASGYFWMDIANPEVRQFLLDLTHEMVAQYGLAGIDLDYTRFPVAADWHKSFDFSPYARNAYQALSGTDPYTIDAAAQPAEWSAWTQWLSDTEDDYVQRAYPDMKNISSGVVVSATPEPGAESQQIGRWSQYVDVVIPQAYSLGSVPPLLQEIGAELAPGNLLFAGIYPFYHHESPELTVEEVLSGRELVSGTNVFAFGQANEPAITALRQGPWREAAISTGLHPIASTTAELQSLRVDVASVYRPRGAMSNKAAGTFLVGIARVTRALSLPEPDLAQASEWLASLQTQVRSGASAGTIRKVVSDRVNLQLQNLQRVLAYSATKHIQ